VWVCLVFLVFCCLLFVFCCVSQLALFMLLVVRTSGFGYVVYDLGLLISRSALVVLSGPRAFASALVCASLGCIALECVVFLIWLSLF